MTKYLFDTNICIFDLRGKFNLNTRIKKAGGFANCLISEITIAELKYGAELSNRILKNMLLIDELIQKVSILPIFNGIGLFAKEKARLKRLGILIDDFDLLIGCSAVANHLVLVTENVNHFNRIENIIIENWIVR
ncbi:ribonuclease VapC [Spirochaetia bacterium]|nr:ribonuclease VapC [Spirochaetia bacterium]